MPLAFCLLPFFTRKFILHDYLGVKNYQTPPLSRVGLIHESTLPYQGEQGGSNLKSIFNLIITSYLCLIQIGKPQKHEEPPKTTQRRTN
ncbi:hypothetical protein B5D77_01840 [Microcystis sp. MC19]|nr:hypothetical protein B5D77_01840 [Microcystis sp. MC19]